jgi:hypothetical protein
MEDSCSILRLNEGQHTESRQEGRQAGKHRSP